MLVSFLKTLEPEQQLELQFEWSAINTESTWASLDTGTECILYIESPAKHHVNGKQWMDMRIRQ